MKIDEKELQRIGEQFAVALANRIGENAIRSVKVEKVDGDTITATRGDEVFSLYPALFGQADKFLAVYPKVGSTVAIVYINGKPSTPYIVACTEIDRVAIKVGESTIGIEGDTITFNGGENGGMVLIEKLTDKLNQLQQQIDAIQTAIATHSHGTPAGATTGTVYTRVNVSRFNASDYENDKIKQ